MSSQTRYPCLQTIGNNSAAVQRPSHALRKLAIHHGRVFQKAHKTSFWHDIPLRNRSRAVNPRNSSARSPPDYRPVLSSTTKISKADKKYTAAAIGLVSLQVSGSQPSPDNEESFVLCPKLPFELRRMICSFALPTRRIIELRHRELVPHALEPMTLMSVCAESRQIAVEAHSLFDLRPSIRADTFYFSSKNTISLLRDENPVDPERYWLWPPVENDDFHPWNVFRNKVTIVAFDPLLYNGPLKMRRTDVTEEIMLAYIQAGSLAAAIATFPNLKQVIVLRRKKHEKRVRLMLERLDYCMKLGSDGYHPMILSSTYGKIPPIRLLNYKFQNGEDALVAMREVLMGYAEKTLKPVEKWIDRGRENLRYRDPR